MPNPQGRKTPGWKRKGGKRAVGGDYRGWCDVHQKVLYSSRSSAKRICHIAHRGERVREYECVAVDRHWHIGHTPPLVTSGEYTIREWYDLPITVRRKLWREATREWLV